MSFRFTIAKKIGTGFGVLILFIIVVFGATYFAVNNGIETFKENDKTSNKIINSITPSKEKIIELRLLVNESKQLAIQWVNNQSREDTPDKERLKRLINQNIPLTQEKLSLLSNKWSSNVDLETYSNINTIIKDLFNSFNDLMMFLPDLESYDDAGSYFFARDLVSQNGDITNYSIDVDIQFLTLQNSFESKEKKALKLLKQSSEKSNEKFQSLKFYWYLGGALILAAILIAVFTTNSIVKPVTYLRRTLLSLGKGVFPNNNMKVSNDEIGDMSDAMNKLVSGLKGTTEFANMVGQSKFNSPFTPLSEDDELGHALLKMRTELAENERILEDKVKERTEEVVKQREKLEELYNDVTDSIIYAKRLQNSILPTPTRIAEICPNSFVYFKPKDIVSGDFYWFEKVDNISLYAAVDCTGHGVPGAFMSLVGANGLNKIVIENKITKPSEILNKLNAYVSATLNHGDSNDNIRDGMDMTLCSIDYDTMKLQYSGANNPLYIVRNNEFIIIKADKFSISSFDENKKYFTNHDVEIQKGDAIYVFSDGYADQFGGERGKKFMYKRFRDLILKNHKKSINFQKEALHSELSEWMGDVDQIDDILVIGLKV